jgi:hypothetical protein
MEDTFRDIVFGDFFYFDLSTLCAASRVSKEFNKLTQHQLSAIKYVRDSIVPKILRTIIRARFDVQNHAYVEQNHGNDLLGCKYGRPFKTITAAISFLKDSDSLFIFPGTYNESLEIYKSNITVTFLSTEDIGVTITKNLVYYTNINFKTVYIKS